MFFEMSYDVCYFTGCLKAIFCNEGKDENFIASQQKVFPYEQKTTDELQDFDVIRDVLGDFPASLKVDRNAFSDSPFHAKEPVDEKGDVFKVWEKVFEEPEQKIPSSSLMQATPGSSLSGDQQVDRKRIQVKVEGSTHFTKKEQENTAEERRLLSIFNPNGHIYIPNENEFIGAGRYGRVYGVIRPISLTKPFVVKTFCLKLEKDEMVLTSYKQEVACYCLMEKFIENRKNVTACKGVLNASFFGGFKRILSFEGVLNASCFGGFKRILPFAGLVFEKYPLNIQQFYNNNRNLELFRRITNQMMDVLDYLSNGLGDKSIVHRDLRLDNIMVDRKGNLKLIDFGLALIVKKGSVISADEINTNNYYLTPEEAFGLDYDVTSDLWKAVTMLYNLKFNEDIVYPQKYSENNEIPSLNTLLRVCGKIPEDIRKQISADDKKESRFDFAINDYLKTRIWEGKSAQEVLEQSPEVFWNRHISQNASQKVDEEEGFVALIDFMRRVLTYLDTRVKVEDLVSHPFLQRESATSSIS
jgi:serine/threonine protein kinase